MTGRYLNILGKAPNNMELYEKYHVIFPVNFRKFREYLERLFFKTLPVTEECSSVYLPGLEWCM